MRFVLQFTRSESTEEGAPIEVDDVHALNASVEGAELQAEVSALILGLGAAVDDCALWAFERKSDPRKVAIDRQAHDDAEAAHALEMEARRTLWAKSRSEELAKERERAESQEAALATESAALDVRLAELAARRAEVEAKMAEVAAAEALNAEVR